MTVKDSSFVEGIAKIGTEETEFQLNTLKFVHPLVSIVMFGVAIYVFAQVDFNKQHAFKSLEFISSVFLIFGALGFAVSSWRVNIIHDKVKKLNNSNSDIEK